MELNACSCGKRFCACGCSEMAIMMGDECIRAGTAPRPDVIADGAREGAQQIARTVSCPSGVTPVTDNEWQRHWS